MAVLSGVPAETFSSSAGKVMCAFCSRGSGPKRLRLRNLGKYHSGAISSKTAPFRNLKTASRTRNQYLQQCEATYILAELLRLSPIARKLCGAKTQDYRPHGELCGG